MVTTTELLAGTLLKSTVESFSEEDFFQLIFEVEQALAEIRVISVKPCPLLINEALQPTLVFMRVGQLISICDTSEQLTYRVTPDNKTALQAFLRTRAVRIVGDDAAFLACGNRLDEIVSVRTTTKT